MFREDRVRRGSPAFRETLRGVVSAKDLARKASEAPGLGESLSWKESKD